MSHNTDYIDDDYLNDFHREWNESCMRENARVQSTCYSPELARAQSLRMKELVCQEEERLKKKRGLPTKL